MQRRTLLSLGAASAAALALAGGSLALLRPGLRQGRLTADGRELFAVLGSALLDGSLPSPPVARRLALDAWLARVDLLVAGLPTHAQDELSQLLALLASAPGRRGLAGLQTPWPQAPLREVQASLQSMRVSSLGLRCQAYQALHDIAGGAYFSETETWAQLGYPGPLAV